MSSTPVVVVASGYFSPIHSGHLEYLELSKRLGDVLIVIVNNDVQEKLKKGENFMKCSERMKIVKALRCVDMVVESVDTDRSVCKTLTMIRPNIFSNGGDVTNENIAEAAVCQQLGIKMVDKLGDKKNSSSSIIARAKEIPDYKNLSATSITPEVTVISKKEETDTTKDSTKETTKDRSDRSEKEKQKESESRSRKPRSADHKKDK